MNYYTNKQLLNFWENEFHFLNISKKDEVFYLTLNRSNKKNALHPQMQNEIAFCFDYISQNNEIKLVVIQSTGDTFSAGADLKALSNNIEPHTSTIPDPNKKIILGNLFNNLYKPKLAIVEGNVYAGGCLIVAGCNYVLSLKDIKFSLPEVKRGIFPLQVMQSISSIIGLKKTIDWCIRGYKINAEIAKEWGLVDEICSKENVQNSVKKWIDDFSGNSNKAIEFGLKAFQEHFHKNSNHEKLEKLFRDMIEKNHLSDEF
ncbi:MAG: enoyl-CoA hydratase [Flavobacteriaceae bacterium]|nr:enoyl-CoA hydratase [Flavobacteriaceae bacterium]|tara:strand:+ start:181 stop:957 length:777 start_codon:yes stop_codon:yes gene_type:complete